MKRLFIAALLPVLMFSCAKEENTNPAFREVTCGDTTDDGIFEQYTLPERLELLRDFTLVPDTPFKGVVRSQYIDTRILHNWAVDYSPYITYHFNVPAKIFAWMPYPNQPEQYYSWVVDAPDTSLDYQVNLYHLRQQSPQLQTGCYRIYYAVGTPDTSMVYTKGHYDIEVRN